MGLRLQTFRSNPRSPFDGRMSSPDQDPRGVKAGGRRTTFRSSHPGGGWGRGTNGASPLAHRQKPRPTTVARDGRSLSTRGKDAEKRETTPPRATCVGYPARRPAEPSGSLPNRRPLETRRELPYLVDREPRPPPVAHRLRDLRRLVRTCIAGTWASCHADGATGRFWRTARSAAAVAALDEQRNLYCRNTDSPVRDPRIAPLQPLPRSPGCRAAVSAGRSAPATPAGSSSPPLRRIRATFASSAA